MYGSKVDEAGTDMLSPSTPPWSESAEEWERINGRKSKKLHNVYFHPVFLVNH
jgi:hypothetical protein